MASERTRKICGSRPENGRIVREIWLEASNTDCEPLFFSDLERGEKFISLPRPGDNGGHGGLLGGAWLFMKIDPGSCPAGSLPFNAVRLVDGCKVNFNDTEWVYLVQ